MEQSTKARAVADAATEHNTAICPLFQLPGEIRNHIYELLFPAGKVVPLRAKTSDGDKNINALPPLAYACKQLRREVAPLYGANSIFLFADWWTSLECTSLEAISAFSRVVGPHITTLRFSHHMYADISGCRIRFTAKLKDGGVTLCRPNGESVTKSSDVVYGTSELYCCCAVLRIAARTQLTEFAHAWLVHVLDQAVLRDCHARRVSKGAKLVEKKSCGVCRGQYYCTWTCDLDGPEEMAAEFLELVQSLNVSEDE